MTVRQREIHRHLSSRANRELPNLEEIADGLSHRLPTAQEDAAFIPMIEPYHPNKVRVDEQGLKIASYGQSSMGYDIRCAPEFKLFRGVDGEPIDYKNIREEQFETFHQDQIILPPNSFVLSRSMERVQIPLDVLVLCIGKSTPARAAISCLCTPLEPGWGGYVTLEFANTSNQPVILYAGEGAVQLVFLKGDGECENPYGDGKYQGQGASIILPRV
jgi:dCTP deaminase